MILHRFSYAIGSAEVRNSLNISLGSTSIWGSKSNDFASVFIGTWERRSLEFAEYKLRFYLSMGKQES